MHSPLQDENILIIFFLQKIKVNISDLKQLSL